MATMYGTVPGQVTRRRQLKLRPYALAIAGAVVALSCLLWFEPFWLLDRSTDLRLAMAGVKNQDVVVDGHRIHYLVGGPANAQGQPLVLVHGLGSRASDWVGLIPALVHGGRRVYALDLLGYGHSDRPADAGYSIEQQAQIVEGFLRAEHLEQVDLAGWSMGGWIAMVVAREMPQAVSRLVLFDSAGVRFQPSFNPALFTPNDVDQLDQLQHLLMADGPTMPAFMARAFLIRARPDAWVIRRSVDAMLTGDNLMDDSLASLKMPVLIVWGKQDMLTPLPLAFAIHAGVPNSELEVIDGCGHLAPGLCAGKIVPRLLHFLREAPAEPLGEQHARLTRPR